jgi:guanylate cyclase 2F
MKTALAASESLINSNIHSSSNQKSFSPTVTCELVDVKVEITPAPTPMSDIQTTFSIESTSSMTLCSDLSAKSPNSASPNTRKFSEFSSVESGGTFLNSLGSFGSRMNPSPPNTASARLFKKLEEMIDLSSPYNHYRCLSPSETNLTQTLVSPNPHRQLDVSGRPNSSRFLRRQFSLDKDDLNQQSKLHNNLDTISSLVDTTKLHQPHNVVMKSQFQALVSSTSLPVNSANAASNNNKMQKHQSISVAQDLEKIEEINYDQSPINSVLNMNSDDIDKSNKPVA